MKHTALEMIRPDDWHLHLRDGAALSDTVPATAASFGRAIVMPNLVPPVRTAQDAAAYRERILGAVPEGVQFQPLMTLYLTDQSTPEIIDEALAGGLVYACKLYPAGATTNSDAGVTRIENLYPALERMAENKLPLLVHGEVVDPQTDIFDREKLFIDQVLAPLADRFPGLRIVLEHITTKEAVEFVNTPRDGVAATITAHHLRYERNHMLAGGIRPHFYCLPVLKRADHRQALQDAVASGSPRFFLGTDSAPHDRQRKENACGCAGCYTAPLALPLYAQTFEDLGILDQLEAFASLRGPAFYGVAPNTQRIRLRRESWKVPETLPLGSGTVIPFLAGETLNWQVEAQ